MTVKSAVSASIMFSKVIDVTHSITFTFLTRRGQLVCNMAVSLADENKYLDRVMIICLP